MGKISFLVLFIFPMLMADGQIFAPRIKHYGIEEGLPSNVNYFVTKDKQGYIWIGTDAGATRFDGANFITYTVNDGLANNDVFNIFCDSKGRVWFTSMCREVCYYYRGIIYNKHNDTMLKKMIFQSEIAPIHEDKEGNIWIPGFENVVYKLSEQKLSSYQCKLKDKGFAFSGHFVWNNKEYITSTKGLLYVENEELKLVDTNQVSEVYNVLNLSPLINVCYLPSVNIRIDSVRNTITNYSVLRRELYLAKESDSSFWFLGIKGLQYFIVGRKQAVTKSMLPGHNPSYVFCDNEKNTWISTLDNGLYKVNAKNNASFIDSKYNINTSFRSVVAIGENIYAGNVKGDLVHLNGNEKPKIIRRLEAKLGHTNRILAMSVFDKQHVVITTDIGSFIINVITGTTSQIAKMGATKNHVMDGKSIIIVGYSFIVIYDIQHAKSRHIQLKKRFYACAQYNEQLIIGAVDGLYFLQHDTLAPYPLNIRLENRISDIKIINNSLFAATSDNGIFKIDHNKCTQQFNQLTGLTNNSCNRILHHQNKLYVATKNGINIIDLNTNKYTYIFEPDGLASNIVNDIFIQNDSLIAATDNGISVFRIKEIETTKAPSYNINPVVIDIKKKWDIKNITAHSDQVIQFFVNSISFSTNGKIKHYYRLKNIDTNWTLTVDPVIVIKNLAPGKYTFESFASNSYNIKSDPVIINITIVPYFYQHWIFKLCTVLFLFIALYFLYRYLFQRLKRQEKNKRDTQHRMTELELHAWRSKINPHFVFNSLNAMQSFFEEQNFETGNIYLSRFSTIMRKTIERSSNLFNTIEDEIEYQSNYLGLEKLKREENFHFEIICPPDILHIRIPSMIIQPVIENCLKHGIQDKIDGKITLRFLRKDHFIYAIITDNGNGLKMHYLPSNGLGLIREKIHLIEKLNPQKIDFQFENIQDENGHLAGLKTTFIFTDSYK